MLQKFLSYMYIYHIRESIIFIKTNGFCSHKTAITSQGQIIFRNYTKKSITYT